MAEQSVNWSQCLQYSAVSDVGMRRSNNQDSHAIVIADGLPSWRERGHVFMVADGMGAHAAGELASKLAVDGVPHLYCKYSDLSPPEALQKAILETNADIHRRGRANTDFLNMGTTASVLVFLPQGALAAHIGDSRVYRLRGDRLDQITFDHSLVWEMQAAGQMMGSEFAIHIPKNVITRSLGPNSTVQVDLEGPLPIEAGDVYMLCSDGLTGEVANEEIGPILASLPPNEAAQVLVDLANLRGGPDNITVIVVKITGEEITTRAAGAQPLMIGKPASRQQVHPFLWIATGVCFLAALVMLLLRQHVAALLAAGGGLVTVLAALYQKFVPPAGEALVGGKRLGKGPYTKTACPPNGEFVDKLAGIVAELREAAKEDQRHVNWAQFDALCQKAKTAEERGAHAGAVSEYARAISFMMNELRSQSKKKTDDSRVDL